MRAGSQMVVAWHYLFWARDRGRNLNERLGRRAARSLAHASYTYKGAFRVGELAYYQTVRRGNWAHHASATETFGALQCRLDVRHADVEQGMAGEVLATADSAADSSAVFGLHEVDEPVAV